MERVSGNEKPEMTLDLLLMRGLLIGGEREKVGHVGFFLASDWSRAELEIKKRKRRHDVLPKYWELSIGHGSVN